MPGPMAARPYPTALRLPWTWAISITELLLSFGYWLSGFAFGYLVRSAPGAEWWLRVGKGSVSFGEGALDVARGEHHEDVCLQNRHERLKKRQQDGEEEGDHRQPLHQHRLRPEHDEAAKGEYQQDDVAGEHVREKTHGQRERADQKRRDELDRDQQEQDRPRRCWHQG